MRVIRVRAAEQLANEAANILCAQLEASPRSTIALPTGRTPLGLYAELVRRAHTAACCLAEARIFNLDEYCGLSPADPASFSSALHRQLIAPLELDAARVRLLKGDAEDPEAECADYETAIAACGGIDLCVLGLGENGHIAFNEPGSAWSERTRVVELAPLTRARVEAASRDAAAGDAARAPTHGITLGIANVLEARHALLLIAGAHKEAATAALARGVEDIAWPVTCLLRHRNATVIELCARAELP